MLFSNFFAVFFASGCHYSIELNRRQPVYNYLQCIKATEYQVKHLVVKFQDVVPYFITNPSLTMLSYLIYCLLEVVSSYHLYL